MIRKLKLPNGLRLLLIPQPSSLATTVLILVEAGSEYETKGINGISHFLEHMTFKGTTTRPRPGMISQELDSLGAQSNAFTSQEYTGYWAKVQHKKGEKIIEIVSDLFMNPIFNQEEIDKERGVVIEEINMYEDTPMRRVQELFTGLLYGDQPAGWDVAGSKEIIRKVTKNNFLEYRAKHYVAPKAVVVIAGNFNETRAIKQIRGLFSHLPRARRALKPGTKFSKQLRPEVLVKFKESDQSHLVLGMEAFNILDKRKYAIEVLGDVLGGGMSSRLFRRVREELGAAYYVRAGADLLIDHGNFTVSAGVDHQKIEKVLEAILQELRRVTTEPVDQKELQKAKDHLSGNLLLSLEGSDELASFYGGQEILMRGFIAPEAFIKKIQGVTAEEVRTVAQALFHTKKLNLAVIGPYKNSAPFKKILVR